MVSLAIEIYPWAEFKDIVPCATPPTDLVFDIALSVIAQPPMFPAFAIIKPFSASIVTEFVPFATLSPFEFNAKPFPDNSYNEPWACPWQHQKTS